MAHVQNIKCYAPEDEGDVYYIQCDSVVGQLSATGRTREEAVSQLKGIVEWKELEWPNVIPIDTGNDSWIYKEPSASDAKVEISAKAPDKEEGKFTLAESIAKCRTFAALEEIVEKNNIDVDLSSIKLFKDQKKAVLKALK